MTSLPAASLPSPRGGRRLIIRNNGMDAGSAATKLPSLEPPFQCLMAFNSAP